MFQCWLAKDPVPAHWAWIDHVLFSILLLLSETAHTVHDIGILDFHYDHSISTVQRLATLKGHKSKFTIVKGETFRNYFIFSPAYSLIMWFIRSSKNFVKIAILKICQLISFWGVKITSAWNKLNLSLNYWFLQANVVFWICCGSKKWFKNHLDTIQTTFCKNESH